MVAGIGDPHQVSRGLDTLRVVEEVRAFARLAAADHRQQTVVGTEDLDLVVVLVGDEQGAVVAQVEILRLVEAEFSAADGFDRCERGVERLQAVVARIAT